MSITSQFTYTKLDILKAQLIVEKRMRDALIDESVLNQTSPIFQMLINQLELTKCDTIIKKEEKNSSSLCVKGI